MRPNLEAGGVLEPPITPVILSDCLLLVTNSANFHRATQRQCEMAMFFVLFLCSDEEFREFFKNIYTHNFTLPLATNLEPGVAVQYPHFTDAVQKGWRS